MAVETVVKHCLDAENQSCGPGHRCSTARLERPTKHLTTAVHLANRYIFKSAEKNPDRHGMGATLTAVWIAGVRLSIAQVGDSRAYLLRGGSLLRSRGSLSRGRTGAARHFDGREAYASDPHAVRVAPMPCRSGFFSADLKMYLWPDGRP